MHRAAVWLLWSGILMLVATFPIAIVAYGRPMGSIVLFTIPYGVLAIGTATALAIFIRIKRRAFGAQHPHGATE